MSAGPYSIGSGHWPGLSKLTEEMGEVQQVLGKLLGTGGAAAHWDGSDLRERLAEELGDTLAAIWFFAQHNGLNLDAILRRQVRKRELFEKWHEEQTKPPQLMQLPALTAAEQTRMREEALAYDFGEPSDERGYCDLCGKPVSQAHKATCPRSEPKEDERAERLASVRQFNASIARENRAAEQGAAYRRGCTCASNGIVAACPIHGSAGR